MEVVHRDGTGLEQRLLDFSHRCGRSGARRSLGCRCYPRRCRCHHPPSSRPRPPVLLSRLAIPSFLPTSGPLPLAPAFFWTTVPNGTDTYRELDPANHRSHRRNPNTATSSHNNPTSRGFSLCILVGYSLFAATVVPLDPSNRVRMLERGSMGGQQQDTGRSRNVPRMNHKCSKRTFVISESIFSTLTDVT